MAQLAVLRRGLAPHAFAIATGGTFLLVSGNAYLAWKLLKDADYGTVLASEFSTWLVTLAVGAGVVAVVGAVFWRGKNVLLGHAAGLVLSALAVPVGVYFDFFMSIGGFSGGA
jgi:hypothetical protein